MITNRTTPWVTILDYLIIAGIALLLIGILSYLSFGFSSNTLFAETIVNFIFGLLPFLIVLGILGMLRSKHKRTAVILLITASIILLLPFLAVIIYGVH